MVPEVVVVQEDRQERKPITTLLLVDDEAPVLEATTWALRTAGFRIYSASSFDAALNILASQTAVSGVIIDRSLVSADLAGSLVRLREVAGSVLIVGTSGADCRDEFLAAGADHFLPKPWTTDQVTSLIESRHLSGRSDRG